MFLKKTNKSCFVNHVGITGDALWQLWCFFYETLVMRLGNTGDAIRGSKKCAPQRGNHTNSKKSLLSSLSLYPTFADS